jgi:16S rRNA (guanine966-N2)-methyltransferase
MLHVIDQPGLRPTQDRVRETLFNWLNLYLQGAICLDVFAGSGVLGLECASRGASFIQFVEFSQKAYNNLKENIKNLQPGPQGCEIAVAREDAIHWLNNHDLTRFEVILIDPPFDNTILLHNALKIVGNVKFRTKSPIIYVESSI